MPGEKSVRNDQPLLPSVLDRLLGDSDDTRHAGPPGLGELQSALRRDMEALLNTHQYCRSLPVQLGALSQSLFEYGMPHFLGLSAASAPAREEFRASIEVLLRRFEPRLKQLTVVLLDNVNSLDRTLRLRIDALLLVDPQPELVSFDSVLESANRRFTVTVGG